MIFDMIVFGGVVHLLQQRSVGHERSLRPRVRSNLEQIVFSHLRRSSKAIASAKHPGV
jgi:hypothetical protein